MNCCVAQTKARAMEYINKLFTKDVQDNFFDNNYINTVPGDAKYKVALISTPRVGSTLLSAKLEVVAGKSISREWLHDKYCKAYQEIVGEDFEPHTYLDQVANLYKRETSTFILNFHVHQFEFWKNEYNINIIDFFNFDKIYYIERESFFDQVFSFAAAMKSGLWGSQIEGALQIGKEFKVIVEEKEILDSIIFLTKQKDNYQTKIQASEDHVFLSEDIFASQGKNETSIIVSDLGFHSLIDNIEKFKVHQPKKQHNIICPVNKIKMKQYFDIISSQYET